jgi:hypothetical protein
MRTTMRAAAAVAMVAAWTSGALAQGVDGAVFTTDSVCQRVNQNIFAAKTDVHVDGGPARVGAAGLPDGSYYVQVTDPSGHTVLGFSNTASVTVTGGEFQECYQLSSILFTASSGFTAPGYDDTPNSGGEYKVWVSQDGAFPNNATKTDNFKVKPPEPEEGTLEVIKFYDANVNGVNDDNQLISGWRIEIKHDHVGQGEPDHEGPDFVRSTPVSIIVDPGTYIVTEGTPVETNWLHTTANPVTVTVPANGSASVEFGNVCLGAGGGKTLGFWSNKNGQAAMTAAGMATQLAALSALSLRNADGTDFDPAAYSAFRTWLLSASATNMAYMLSAQLSATSLNSTIGAVSPSALVYAPGCGNTGVGGNFISIADLIAAADASLSANGLTLDGHPERAAQECLKNALDASNNNRNFVQSGACAFSFAQ